MHSVALKLRARLSNSSPARVGLMRRVQQDRRGESSMKRRTSDGWSKRVGTGVGPPPSLWDRYGTYGLILALVAAIALTGLTLLSYVEH
jgi:hypothetical protein